MKIQLKHILIIIVVNVVKSGRKWQREIESWVSFGKLLSLQRTPHTIEKDRIPILCFGRLRWISQVWFRAYWLERFCPSFSCAFPSLSVILSLSLSLSRSLSLSLSPSFRLSLSFRFSPPFLPFFLLQVVTTRSSGDTLKKNRHFQPSPCVFYVREISQEFAYVQITSRWFEISHRQICLRQPYLFRRSAQQASHVRARFEYPGTLRSLPSQ